MNGYCFKLLNLGVVYYSARVSRYGIFVMSLGRVWEVFGIFLSFFPTINSLLLSVASIMVKGRLLYLLPYMLTL